MDCKQHIILQSAGLIEALETLNKLSGGIMTLMAIDDAGVMTGTLTDGDVRRAILAGATLDSKVEDVMHREFKSMSAHKIDVEAIRQYRRAGIKLLPLLRMDGKIERLLNLDDNHTHLPVSAVLMAGGLGERLRPMTDTLPKPLLPIAGKPIIDYNIEALAAAGIDDITVSTRYLAEKLEEHFAEPVADVRVKCIKEDCPLGTIGALSLMKRPEDTDTTLVMNSDLLTTISFEEMYLTHVERKALITVAVLPYVVSIPYAILSTCGDKVSAIEEKPTFTYYANAGIYMIENTLLETLIPGQHLDATDFIENAINDGVDVAYYPINGTWIDIGTPSDFKQAEQLMQHLRNFSHS